MQYTHFALLLVVLLVNVQSTISKHIQNKHLIRRSIRNKHNKISIDSAVEDIRESTAFADRERKWNALIKGELYPEHMEGGVNKRKEIEKYNEKTVNIEKKKYKPELNGGEKKDRIENHSIERENFDETLEAEDYDDANNQDNGNNDDSGSGSGETIGADIKSDEEPQQEEEESSTGDRRQEKLQCHRKCSMPMTYHECAHPRCGLKVGSIKDLCFYLCKHQKERCEDVCE